MLHKDFQGKKLPQLGLGTMRLPVVDGVYADIDTEQTEKMIAYAMEHGANYFDTAWGYHDGNSEPVVGELLSHYPRETFYLASKFPGYDLSNMNKVEEIFEAQLKRCRVEYFDFYLFHNVCELNIDSYLDESNGILTYLLTQKKKGRIKHLGFSAHGSLQTIKSFLETYGEHMEFCQLQINWVDWKFQDAREKVELAISYGIPVWVMEPLRGGKLASLSPQDEARLKELRPDETIPAWSFRFLQSLPEVTLVLCGASNLDQLKQNIATFEEEKPLSSEEKAALQKIADTMMNSAILPCTECRYCIEYCPQELDIPELIGLYNERNFTGRGDFIASMALAALPDGKKPSACTSCKSCEAVCPQQLEIAKAMADFTDLLKK